MQITYRIPSKKVPYGYIEISADLSKGEALPDPETLAAGYADYISRYQKAEVQAFENPKARTPATVASVLASAKDDDAAIDEATKILTEGLGPVSEVDGDDPAAPWNNKTSDTDTSPSEESPSSAVDDGDWDFG